jgi:hypothetical protein
MTRLKFRIKDNSGAVLIGSQHCHYLDDIANVFNFVDRGFEPQSGQTKDFKIGICCFSAEHAALRGKSKDGLAWNQDNGVTCLSMDCCFSELAL